MSTVEIGVGDIKNSCYSGSAIGENYLVYAFGKSDDDLGSRMCTRTTNLSDAADRLPPGYVVRQLEGDVVWPNGAPVADAWVCVTASRYAADEDQKFGCDSTDFMGKFSLQAFVGAEYWIYCRIRSSGKGEPRKLTVQMNNEPLRLIMPLPKHLDY